MTKRGTLIIFVILFIFLLALLIIFTSKQTMTGFVISPGNAIRDFFSKLFGAKEVEIKAEGEARILVNLTFDNATHISSETNQDTGADGAARAFYLNNPDPVRTDLPSPQGGKNIRARVCSISSICPPTQQSSPMVWVDRKLNGLDEFYIKFYMYIEPDIITLEELVNIKMFYINKGEFYTGNYYVINMNPRYNQWYIYGHINASGEVWSPYNAHPGFQQGKWVLYEFYTKYNTPGYCPERWGTYNRCLSDGILRIWVDGNLSWEQTDIYFRDSPDFVMDSFGAVLHFQNSGAIDGHMRLDAIELWDGMPTIGPDTTPPQRSNGQPTGTLPSGTTQTTLSLTTNEVATCKYATNSGIDYASMPNTFTTTGGTSHSTLLTGLTDGFNYSYYVRCQDIEGHNNPDDFPISFSVALCGNNIKELNEICDGTDLSPYTSNCSSYPGYISGTLACLPDCSNYNFSSCELDETPPQIIILENRTVLDNKAEIYIKTDEDVNTTIEYWHNMTILNKPDSNYTKEKIITLDNLKNATLYFYNVTVCDIAGNCNISAIKNFTTLLEFIDNIAPVINLISPSDGYEWTSSTDVTFSFNVTDETTVNCNLTINITVANKTNLQREVGDSFSYALGNGWHNWSIWCIDEAGNENRSEIRELYVNYQAPIITDGDRGGDGGGGAPPATTPPCTEDWRCDKWNDCVEGKQTRTCWDRNLCNTTIKKPTEQQACIEEEGKPLGEGGIVEVIKKPYFKYIIIAAIVVVIATVTVIYLIKFRHAKLARKQIKPKRKIKAAKINIEK